MLFSGLKMQIAGTLIVLLSLAIFLSSIVLVAFWQKGLVRSEIEHMRSYWATSLPNNSAKMFTGSVASIYDLKTLCRSVGKHCVGVTLSGGEYWFKGDVYSIKDKCQKLAQKSAVSKKEMIYLEGESWGGFSFTKSYLLIAEPLSHDVYEEQASVVVALELNSVYESIFNNHKAIFVYLLVNVILLTVVGFFRLLAIVIKPVERMVVKSESYHESSTLFSRGEEKRTEFGQLSMSLDRMLSRIESDREKLRKTVLSLETSNTQLIETQKEMLRTEKLASVGVLSAGLAHEIGNPIGIVQGYVELLQQADISEADKQQYARRAQCEIDRINTLIRQLLDYSRSSSEQKSVANLKQLVEGVCEIASMNQHNPSTRIVNQIPVDIYVRCDEERIRQVLLNCFLNALDAIDSKKGDFDRQLLIIAKKAVDEEVREETVHITIEDNGVGIAAEELEKIFDPFFTTKDPGKGTGLGLFVSHSLIDAHGGKIWLESSVGVGTSVHIMLPLDITGDSKGHDEATHY